MGILARMSKTVPRMFVASPLSLQARVVVGDKQAHYLQGVMRLKAGDTVALFNGSDGEWQATIAGNTKHEVTLECTAQTRPHAASPDMMVCFAPPRGGRIDSIIEKATELGARVLQPVRTERSVVDKINTEKWQLAVREAAEQCERLDVPDIRPMVTLGQLLAGWDAQRPLFYGDESGASAPLDALPSPVGGGQGGGMMGTDGASYSPPPILPPIGGGDTARWAILTGPEGGFTPQELAHMRSVQGVHGISLGPRILRTDTAVITLCALTQARFGDWELRPRFENPS